MSWVDHLEHMTMNNLGGVNSGKYLFMGGNTPRLYSKITPDPAHLHLGDLINIVQKYAEADLIIGTHTCDCCGQKTGETLRFLCNLLQCRLKVTDQDQPADVVRPSWCETPPLRRLHPYRKPVHSPLPKAHITCDFGGRSSPAWWRKTLDAETIDAIRPILGNPINIGDRAIVGYDNRTGISLPEKYRLIASSVLYVGIDNGLAHLAVMAGVKTVVMHNETLCPWFFYPESEDLTFVSSLGDLAAIVMPIKQSLPRQSAFRSRFLTAGARTLLQRFSRVR